MAHFGQFFAKMGETGFFFKKALGTFFPPLQALTNCKVSEKSNERISRKAVANERMDRRTDGRTNERTNGRGLNSRFFRILRRTNYNKLIIMVKVINAKHTQTYNLSVKMYFAKSCYILIGSSNVNS